MRQHINVATWSTNIEVTFASAFGNAYDILCWDVCNIIINVNHIDGKKT